MARKKTTFASLAGGSRRRPAPSAMQQRVNAATAQWARDWLTVTFATDTVRWLVAVNWLVLIGLGGWAYLIVTRAVTAWGPFAFVAGIWLIGTFIRGAVTAPRRRQVLNGLYGQLMRVCGWPRASVNSPADPRSVMRVKTWRRGRPTRAVFSVGHDSIASNLMGRGTFAQAIANNIALPKGHDWLIDWSMPTSPLVHAVPADDPRVAQQRTTSRTAQLLAGVFRATPKVAAEHGHDFTVDEWIVDEEGNETNRPAVVTFIYGTQPEPAGRAIQDAIERQCDTQNLLPGACAIYDWSEPGALHVSSAPLESVAAARKLITRRIADQIAGVAGRGKDPVLAVVTQWGGAPGVAMPAGVDSTGTVPYVIEVDLGTRAFGDAAAREKLEIDIDHDLEAAFAGLTFEHAWMHSAASTGVVMTAYASHHPKALEKVETRRWRQVVSDKFGGKRSGASVAIVDWTDDRDAAGRVIRRRPAQLRVSFGAHDVSKSDTRDNAMAHFDQLTDLNDWRYQWNEAEGYVDLTAVPPLPTFLPFPVPGTAEFDEWNTLARQGVFRLGPAKGGGWIELDLNTVPHALYGGKTGAGKSVGLSEILFGVLYNPDALEVCVADPKRTDFTWTPEFPGCRQFGDTDERIIALVQAVADEMDRRQSLLNRRGVRNMRLLRALYAKHPEYEAEDGPCPRRLILFFDEIADFLAKSANKDVEEAKQGTRANLEKMARLARATEINIIAAAQKPAGDILSTQLRANIPFRVCVGAVDKDTSQQIMESDHGRRFPETGTPRGRAWTRDPVAGYRMMQIPWLPDDPEPFPPGTGYSPDAVMPGAKDLLRQRLVELGYSRIEIPNGHGGREARWVHRNKVDEGAA